MKTVNGTMTNYKYDGWNVTREMNADESQTLYEYTYDQVGKPLSMRRNSATYYYIYNARGDVTALVDSNGTVTNSYRWQEIQRVMDTRSWKARTSELSYI